MKIFFDGQCPLCRAEMEHLKKHDARENIELVDIHSNEFEQNYPELTKQETMSKLHAYDTHGKKVIGLDVTYQAWRTVGKYKWLKVLRVQPIKWFADRVYLLFAKHREPIAKFICTLLKMDKKNDK